jgi:pimeloyl-ACP methyl ester carboxylesterase
MEPSSETGIRDRRVNVAGSEAHILESGRAEDPCVLLLHGAAFQARTWLDLGTLDELARAGFHAIAIDLPGYGDTPKGKLGGADFLVALLPALAVERVVLVSPSMSGGFSLPFVASHADAVLGFVAVAPVGIAENAAALTGSKVPALLLWGEKDTIVPVATSQTLAACFKDQQVVVLEGARHPCYLDAPARFHELLTSFAKRVTTKR